MPTSNTLYDYIVKTHARSMEVRGISQAWDFLRGLSSLSHTRAHTHTITHTGSGVPAPLTPVPDK